MSGINKFLFFMLLPLMTACASHTAGIAPSAPSATRSDAALISQLEEIRRMQTLVEQSLVLRSKAIRFYQAHALKEKQAGHEVPLSPAELSRLYDGARAYLDVREELKTIGLKQGF